VNKTKKALIAALVLGALTAVGAGTYATFSAQTGNPANTFATGTIVLSDQGPVTTCLSTAGGATDSNVNPNCDTLVSLTVQTPGGAGATQNLTLKNVGSLNAAALKAFSTACTDANAAAETYHGTGSPCSSVQLYIQQWTSAARTTVTACLYGGAVVANTCDFSDTTKTIGAFQTAHPNLAGGQNLGALTAGSSVFLTIGVAMPASTAGNNMQGRSASFDLTWNIQ
jgi:hypothetical protein